MSNREKFGDMCDVSHVLCTKTQLLFVLLCAIPNVSSVAPGNGDPGTGEGVAHSVQRCLTAD